MGIFDDKRSSLADRSIPSNIYKPTAARASLSSLAKAMQSDEVVWQIINHGQCSYRATSETSNFCRNEFSLTGMCNRSSCPLSNSQYATIREECGILNLYTKTVERSHMPSKLWEKTELSPKYAEALEQINSSLRHWPKFLVHKSKQRLTKLTQLLIRSRKLEK